MFVVIPLILVKSALASKVFFAVGVAIFGYTLQKCSSQMTSFDRGCDQ